MHLSIRERIRAAFVIFFFTFTNLLPSGFSQVSSVSPERIPLPHLELNLPPELGRVEDFYVPNAADSSPFIIHVQSAHGDVETQKKIKEILRFLRDSLGIRLVFAEGASEPLRPELLKFFSDPPTNLRMADLLLQKGIYTGVDLFLLDPNGVDTLGIENSRFYRTAYENFKKVLLNSGRQAESKIKQIELGLDRAASKTLSKDSFSLVKNWQKFQERQLGLLPSAHFLAGRAKRDLKLDLADPFSQLEWPQFVRLARLEEFEKNLDREKLEEERRKIDRSFGELSPNDDEIPDPRRTFEHFLEKAFPLGFRFEDYPNFTRWIGSLILRAELDGRILSQEFDRLWHHLKDSEAKTEEEREFFRRYENLILLKKLLHLELTREEWGKIKVGLRRKLLSPTQLGPKAVLEILGFRGWENPAKGAKRGTGWAPSTESRRFPAKRPAVEEAIFSRSVFSALRFYRLTERRESIFFKTLAREMKTRKQTKAILVTGGFHTPGLAHIFKEKGFGYAVITPRMDKEVDSDIYRKTMLDLSQMEIIEFAQRSEARAIQGRNIEKEEALVRSLFGEVALGSSRRGPLHWEDTAYVRDLRDEIKIPSRAEVRKARDSSEPHHDFQQRAEKWNLPGSQKTSGIRYPLGPPKYSGSLGFSSPEGKGVSDSLQGVGSAYRLSFEEGREVSGASDESSRRQRPSRMKGAEEALYRPVTDHAAPPLVSSRSTLHPLPSLGPKPGLVQVKSGTGLQKESKPQDLFHFRGAQPIQDSRNRPRNLGHRFHRKVNGNTIPASKQPSRRGEARQVLRPPAVPEQPAPARAEARQVLRPPAVPEQPAPARAAIIGPKGPLTARGEVRTDTGAEDAYTPKFILDSPLDRDAEQWKLFIKKLFEHRASPEDLLSFVSHLNHIQEKEEDRWQIENFSLFIRIASAGILSLMAETVTQMVELPVRKWLTLLSNPLMFEKAHLYYIDTLAALGRSPFKLATGEGQTKDTEGKPVLYQIKLPRLFQEDGQLGHIGAQIEEFSAKMIPYLASRWHFYQFYVSLKNLDEIKKHPWHSPFTFDREKHHSYYLPKVIGKLPSVKIAAAPRGAALLEIPIAYLMQPRLRKTVEALVERHRFVSVQLPEVLIGIVPQSTSNHPKAEASVYDLVEKFQKFILGPGQGVLIDVGNFESRYTREKGFYPFWYSLTGSVFGENPVAVHFTEQIPGEVPSIANGMLVYDDEKLGQASREIWETEAGIGRYEDGSEGETLSTASGIRRVNFGWPQYMGTRGKFRKQGALVRERLLDWASKFPATPGLKEELFEIFIHEKLSTVQRMEDLFQYPPGLSRFAESPVLSFYRLIPKKEERPEWEFPGIQLPLYLFRDEALLTLIGQMFEEGFRGFDLMDYLQYHGAKDETLLHLKEDLRFAQIKRNEEDPSHQQGVDIRSYPGGSPSLVLHFRDHEGNTWKEIELSRAEVRPPLKIGGRGEQPAEATRDKLSTRFVKTNHITRTLLKPLSSPAEILADPRVREEIWELSGKEIRPETAFRLGKAIGVFHPKYSKEVLLMMLRALRVGDRQIRQERIPVYLRKIIEDLRARGISLEEKNQETGAQISIYDHVPTRSEFAALVFAQAMIPLPDLPAEVVIYPARELSSQALTRLQRSEAQIKKMKNIEGKPIQIHFFYHIQPRKISQYFQKIASSLTARLRQRLGQDARTHIVVTLTEDLARRLETEDSSPLLPLYGIKQVRYGTPKNPSYYSALQSAAVSLSKRDYESLQGLDRLILERQAPFLYASRYDRVPGDWQEIWPFAQARILEEAFAAAA